MHTWLKTQSILVLPLIWLTGCASPSSHLSVPVAGGQTVVLERQGTGLKQAENDRVTVAEPSLQAVNLNDVRYVRWSFAISPKQATALSTIRIEDVSDPAPLLLVNDLAPQLDAGKWSETAGLMDLSSGAVRWLFEPRETVRTFRFTIGEPDGQSYVLYQAAPYSAASKEAIRAIVK